MPETETNFSTTSGRVLGALHLALLVSVTNKAGKPIGGVVGKLYMINLHRLIERHFNNKKSSRLWNLKWSTKATSQCNEAVSMDKLVDHFKSKFSARTVNTPVIEQAKKDIAERYHLFTSTNPSKKFVFPECRMRHYIKRLRSGCTPGIGMVSQQNI